MSDCRINSPAPDFYIEPTKSRSRLQQHDTDSLADGVARAMDGRTCAGGDYSRSTMANQRVRNWVIIM